ncbi:MAG: hypothetical protein ACKVQS_04885 [Fimbriimonadaceae bacterium]
MPKLRWRFGSFLQPDWWKSRYDLLIMARFFVFGLVVLCALFGCQSVGGVTAVAPAKVPEGWKKESVPGTKMSLVLPPFLGEEKLTDKGSFADLVQALSREGSLHRMYSGPDSKGRDCMVSVMAFCVQDNRTNPEGAINEYVDLMGSFSFGAEMKTTKRKVELPVGTAWRAVVTMGSGATASSTIVYAGRSKELYYQVMFMESGAGDVVLVPDEEIMDSLRFE